MKITFSVNMSVPWLKMSSLFLQSASDRFRKTRSNRQERCRPDLAETNPADVMMNVAEDRSESVSYNCDASVYKRLLGI